MAAQVETTATLGARVESPFRVALARFMQHRLAMVALVILGAIVVLSAGAPLFTQYKPLGMSLGEIRQAPSAAHWLGTDTLGRDIWARTLHGGRVSLAIGLAAAVISTVVGVTLGAVAGFFGKWIDHVIMRVTDVVLTFPTIIIMMTVAALLGPGTIKLVFIIGGLRWPAIARLVRGQVLALTNQEFITAARTLGLSNWSIIVRHTLPHVVAPLVAAVTFEVSAAILLEAGLSFLGFGVPLPTPTWGNMMQSARDLVILQEQPWMWAPPAIFTLLTILCINFVGDGLRDAFDPQQLIGRG